MTKAPDCSGAFSMRRKEERPNRLLVNADFEVDFENPFLRYSYFPNEPEVGIEEHDPLEQASQVWD